MSKFTPGPWKWVSDRGWDAVAEAKHVASIICDLKLNNPANARLIAAAPEMYELLKQLANAPDYNALELLMPKVDDFLDDLGMEEAK